MSVELDGMSDEWAVISDFFGESGYFEKIEAVWEGREITIQSPSGREEEIFRAEQIRFAQLQQALQKEETLHVLYGRIEYPLPFEELFLDPDGDIMLAPSWGIDPNQEFVFAGRYLPLQAHSCGLKKFWKKHKKAILITAVVVVVVVGTVVAITVLSSSAASAIAGVGGGALTDIANGDSSPPPAKPSTDKPISSSPLEPPKSSVEGSFVPSPLPIDPSFSSPSLSSELPPLPPSGWTPLNLPPASFPSYSPPLSNNLGKNLPPPTEPLPDMTKFWEIKSPVPFAPISSFQPPAVEPTPPRVSEIFSDVLKDLPKEPPVNSPLTDRAHLLQDPIANDPKIAALHEELKSYPSNPYLVGWLGLPLEIEGDRFRVQKTHSFSERLPTLGTPNPDLLISGINGMNTSIEEARAHQAYLSSLVDNRAPIDFFYNHSNSAPIDALEIFCLNYCGHSPITADGLQTDWQRFAEYHKDNPAKKILQPCHSQASIHVYNALKASPKELRDRVIVVNIAPAKVIPKELCYDSFNYASKRDIVNYGEALFASGLDCPHPDLEASELWQITLENRGELILIEPHDGATGIDHDFQSPTYKDLLKDHLNDYINRNGEYP